MDRFYTKASRGVRCELALVIGRTSGASLQHTLGGVTGREHRLSAQQRSTRLGEVSDDPESVDDACAGSGCRCLFEALPSFAFGVAGVSKWF